MKQDSHRTKLDIFVGEKERIITKRGGKSHNNKRWILNELLVSVMYPKVPSYLKTECRYPFFFTPTNPNLSPQNILTLLKE